MYFISIIRINRPQVSLYDSEGKLRTGVKAYTDSDYRLDLEKDNNPYKTLYGTYEHKWCYFKIYVMIIKFILILPITIRT